MKPSIRRRRVAALAVAAALFTSACQGGAAAPGASDVDVDTPKLRELKADAGIEPCVPGPGGGQLPDLTLPCLGGGDDVDLASLKGPLLINLWGSTCGPCLDEMPVLQEFHEKHPDVGVLGINVVDNYPEAAISFADHVGATYPQLADPSGFIYEQSDLRVSIALPQSIVIDADGNVVAQKAGELPSLKDVEALVGDQLGDNLGENDGS